MIMLAAFSALVHLTSQKLQKDPNIHMLNVRGYGYKLVCSNGRNLNTANN